MPWPITRTTGCGSHIYGGVAAGRAILPASQWFPVNPSESTSRGNQPVIHEDAAGDSKPTTKRNLNSLACSVPISDLAPKPTTKCKSCVFILNLAIDNESLARKPTVFDAYLMALVFDAPAFHSVYLTMKPTQRAGAGSLILIFCSTGGAAKRHAQGRAVLFQMAAHALALIGAGGFLGLPPRS